MVPTMRDKGISIVHPRVGRDMSCGPTPTPPGNFNPPSPGGEGQEFFDEALQLVQFQSTLPARGGTAPAAVDFDGMTFQSTLPLWGGTRLAHSR